MSVKPSVEWQTGNNTGVLEL